MKIFVIGEVLVNGAIVIDSSNVDALKRFVLAVFNGKYVTWGVGEGKYTYKGNYFDDLDKAVKDFKARNSVNA